MMILTEILEKGSIYFLYRPIEKEAPLEGEGDVQRLWILLSTHQTHTTGRREKQCYRLLVTDLKQLPDPEEEGSSFWVSIQLSTDDAREMRKALASEKERLTMQELPAAMSARPIAEGVYMLVWHRDHTHLLYALEAPKEIGKVQQTFNIRKKASYLVSIRNPQAPMREGEQEKALYPETLQKELVGQSLISLPDAKYLDYPGTELLFSGTTEDSSAMLDTMLQPAQEKTSSMGIFEDLGLDQIEHPVTSLFEGEWEQSTAPIQTEESPLYQGTTTHDLIRHWIETYSGQPQLIFNPDRPNTPELWIDFPGILDDRLLPKGDVEAVSWEAFFSEFEQQRLGFEYVPTPDLEDPSQAYVSYRFVRRIQ